MLRRKPDRLDGLLDQSGTETAGADADTFGGTMNHRADRLKIRPEDSISFIVGMADVMTGLMSLAANLTYIRHGLNSFSTRFVVLKTSAMLP